LRKAYWVERFVTSTDSELKIIYAAKAQMSSAEMNAGTSYLKMLRNEPKLFMFGAPTGVVLVFLARKWLNSKYK
jgi:hypothetical protein